MDSRKISIDEEEAFPLAEKRFIQTCGFDLSTEKHRRMMEMGLKVLEDGVDGIDIRAMYAFCSPGAFHDGKITVNGTEISCNYFAQVPPEHVRGIYFYLLTAGECYFSSEENIMDFLYADIWGTNFVDAGIELMTEKIRKDLSARFPGEDLFLSEEFGPGYFGMPVAETGKFLNVLDGSEINVRVKESGLMIPQKTCAGLYLVLDSDEIKAEPECTQCAGHGTGCQFCVIRAKREGAGK